jgi:trimethylamine--corrinoid protein Co-methyltransferase
VSDEQLGHEKTLTALVPALAGASLIYGSGMTESGVTFDCAQFVIDNEIARMIRLVVRGLTVSDETLLVDDIHTVGPFGDYLSLPSTLAGMRGPSTSLLFDRRVREDWEADGAKDVYEIARAQALEILEDHRPEPLDADVVAAVKAVSARVDRELGR